MFGRRHDKVRGTKPIRSTPFFGVNQLNAYTIGPDGKRTYMGFAAAHQLVGNKWPNDQRKFTPGGDPLEMENQEQLMKGHDYRISQAAKEELDAEERAIMVPSDGRPKPRTDLPAEAKVMAIEKEKYKNKRKELEQRKNQEFVRGFVNWLVGQGTEEQYMRSFGWNKKQAEQWKKQEPHQRIFSNHPSVLEFVGQWQNRVLDYEQKLAKMRLRFGRGDYGKQPSIKDSWLYYKYIVMGHPFDPNDFAGDLPDDPRAPADDKQAESRAGRNYTNFRRNVRGDDNNDTASGADRVNQFGPNDTYNGSINGAEDRPDVLGPEAHHTQKVYRDMIAAMRDFSASLKAKQQSIPNPPEKPTDKDKVEEVKAEEKMEIDAAVLASQLEEKARQLEAEKQKNVEAAAKLKEGGPKPAAEFTPPKTGAEIAVAKLTEGGPKPAEKFTAPSEVPSQAQKQAEATAIQAKQDIHQLGQVLQTQTKENEDLRNLLGDASIQAQQQLQAISQLEKEKNALQTEVEYGKGEKAALHEKYNQLISKAQDLEHQLIIRHSHLEKAAEHIQSLETTLASTQQAAGQAVKTLESQSLTLAQNIQKLQQEKEEYHKLAIQEVSVSHEQIQLLQNQLANVQQTAQMDLARRLATADEIWQQKLGELEQYKQKAVEYVENIRRQQVVEVTPPEVVNPPQPPPPPPPPSSSGEYSSTLSTHIEELKEWDAKYGNIPPSELEKHPEAINSFPHLGDPNDPEQEELMEEVKKYVSANGQHKALLKKYYGELLKHVI